jgi:prepilin-type N-terminal cleavage/methylation domain-containing protein
MKTKAFTLIELLVVIAIIAILAAILFPVFARAKEAAKDAAAISNVKQIALAHIMYATDYDDAFVLSARSNSAGWDTWPGMLQPYTKNWDVELHPKLPSPSGPWYYWWRMQHWGSIPRAISKRTSTVQEFQWNGGTLTGGQIVRFDGLLGAGIATGSTWYEAQDASSITQSNVADVAGMILTSEAGNWDMGFTLVPGVGNEMGWCVTWLGGAEQPGKLSITGPHARKNSLVALTGCLYPNGMTNLTGVDGHAKALDYRGKVLGRAQRPNGTWVHPMMHPGGVN